MKAREFTSKQSLVIFDIDDTLLHTTAKIKVVNAGKVVKELTNQEFNHYELQPGEQFDFGEFKNAEKFRQESKPIKPMIRRLKNILANAKDSKVIMLTARADFDDKHTFLDTFANLGIDMSHVHVHRAGNLPGNNIPAEKKAVWVRHYLDTHAYSKVTMYDDSMTNLKVFKKLALEYPNVNFAAFYVSPTGNIDIIENRTVFTTETQDYLKHVIDYAKGHYSEADDIQAVLQFLARSVGHAKEDDAKQYEMIKRLHNQIKMLASKINNKSDVDLDI